MAPEPPTLSNAWLAESAAAYEAKARREQMRAEAIKPDTWARRTRIERHRAQAAFYALHVQAFDDLRRCRQAGERS